MIEQERRQALEMRERAMERIGQTKKRTTGTSESAGQVQKRSKSGKEEGILGNAIEAAHENSADDATNPTAIHYASEAIGAVLPTANAGATTTAATAETRN